MNIQTQIEITMIEEIKELGTEIRIDEYRPDGSLIKSKVYVRLAIAARKLINHAQGYFPIYQNSSVNCMGYKTKISIN